MLRFIVRINFPLYIFFIAGIILSSAHRPFAATVAPSSHTQTPASFSEIFDDAFELLQKEFTPENTSQLTDHTPAISLNAHGSYKKTIKLSESPALTLIDSFFEQSSSAMVVAPKKQVALQTAPSQTGSLIFPKPENERSPSDPVAPYIVVQAQPLNPLTFIAMSPEASDLNTAFSETDILLLSGISGGATGASSGMTLNTDNNLDDYDDDIDTPQAIRDPLEPWNRFWFHFNDFFYMRIATPVYKGYVAVMPTPFQAGLKNFFHNALFPVRFINNLLQGRPLEAGVEFGRFFVNTTVGIGGFINAAEGRKTIVPVDPAGEDFGQTLGRWGVGHGFYIVWPFLGPSSLRETFGTIGDTFANPVNYVPGLPVPAAATVGRNFVGMDSTLSSYNDITGIALDPYIAMREAYILYRNSLVKR